MAAYIKELLLDLAIDKLDIISRIDIEYSLQKLLDRGEITSVHIQLLQNYIYGYTLHELEFVIPNAKELIIMTMALLEHETGYTDESLLQHGLSIYPKYAKIADALRKKLDNYGRDL